MQTSTKVLIGVGAFAAVLIAVQTTGKANDSKDPKKPAGPTYQKTWTDRLRKVLASRLTNLPTNDLTDALASSAAGSFQGMHQHAYAPSAMDASNTTVDTKPMSAVLAALDANHLTVHVPSSLKSESAAVPSIIDYWITSEFDPAPVSGYIALV